MRAASQSQSDTGSWKGGDHQFGRCQGAPAREPSLPQQPRPSLAQRGDCSNKIASSSSSCIGVWLDLNEIPEQLDEPDQARAVFSEQPTNQQTLVHLQETTEEETLHPWLGLQLGLPGDTVACIGGSGSGAQAQSNTNEEPPSEQLNPKMSPASVPVDVLLVSKECAGASRKKGLAKVPSLLSARGRGPVVVQRGGETGQPKDGKVGSTS